MSYRPDYDIARHGEHKSYALQSERGFAPVGRSDLFAAQLGQPDVEDCSNGVIPDKAEPMDGKKKIHVPVLTTMNKVLFDHYRLSMYTYVNRLLRSGTLSRIVGARMLNRVVNREVLSFPSVSFWRIDRTNFYADVRVQLKLKTEKGSLVWIGYLVLWCAFNAEFECGIEELTDEVDRKADGYDPLDSHLIPYHNNRRVDAVSEGIWGKYLPEAIDDPQKRNPIALAEKMGLTVKYCRIYEHRGVSTIETLKEENRRKDEENERLRQIILNLQRAQFGHRSEKRTYVLDDGNQQLSLFDTPEKSEETPNPESSQNPEKEICVSGHSRKKKRTLEELCASLPVEERIVEANPKRAADPKRDSCRRNGDAGTQGKGQA